MERTIRVAAPGDAAELLALYRPYVEETAISFEWETPTLEEFTARIRRTLTKYPYLVLEQAGELLGYAYLSPFHTRAAYAWGAETTIYLRRDSLGQGVGKALYTALEAVAKAQHIRCLYACIGVPRGADPYLTDNSRQFHAHLGYRQVGEFQACGYKFGRWYDMVWMEKWLAAGEGAPQPVIPFPQLDRAALARLGIQL